MRKFLVKYAELLFFLPIWYICGSVHEVLGYITVFLTLIYWYSQRRHHFFLMSFFFVTVMADGATSGMGFAANLRIPILFFIMFFAVEAFYRGSYGIKSIYFASFPFFIVAFLSLLNSPTFILGFAKTVSYFFLVFIIIHYLPYIIKQSGAEMLFDIIYFVILFITLSLVLLPIAPSVVTWHHGSAWASFRGFFHNPNGLGIFCTMTVPLMFILGHIFTGKRILFIYATGIIILCAILADSRTALGSIVLFFSLYFFYTFFRDPKYPKRLIIGRWATRFLWWVAIPIGCLLLYSFGLIGLIESLGLGETLEVQTLETGAGRFIAWEHALEEISKNPWFGNGFHYDVHHFRSIQKILRATGHSGGTHNSYLSFLLDFGIIGLVFFLYFLYKLFASIKGYARNFIVPYFAVFFFTSNFEAWLASSINYVTIYFFLTITSLIYFDTFQKSYLESKNIYKDSTLL